MDPKLFKSIGEIKTPIGFLCLTILVTEALLFALIKTVAGVNTTIITVGMVTLPFFILGIFYLIFKDHPNGFEGGEIEEEEAEKIVERKYDLFVSVPMAAFDTTTEYEAFRSAILDCIRGIKNSCAFSDVFYAGQEIGSFKEFESEDLSVTQVYSALKNSSNFLLIYPKKLPTSALIELGWAMVMNKPIIIFSKGRDELPYLMKNADSVYKNIAIYEYKTSLDIQARFSANKRKLFESLTSKSSGRKKTSR